MNKLTIKLEQDGESLPLWHAEINTGGGNALNKEILDKEGEEFIGKLKEMVSVFLLTRTRPEYPEVLE